MIDERYVVPPEVVVFPVERLAAAIQAQLGTKAGEFAVTNPAGRGTTTVLSPETAELMRCFSEPVSVARAVVGYSAGRQADPHLVLDEAYPVLRQLMAAGFLVAADCETGVPDELPVQVDEFDVVKLVHRLPDVMVLRARTPAGEEVALKVLRPAGNGAGTAVGSAELRREAALLRAAAGCRVPRLVRDGSDHDVPYLAMSWVDGVHLLDRAARGRRNVRLDQQMPTYHQGLRTPPRAPRRHGPVVHGHHHDQTPRPIPTPPTTAPRRIISPSTGS